MGWWGGAVYFRFVYFLITGSVATVVQGILVNLYSSAFGGEMGKILSENHNTHGSFSNF